MSFGHRRQEILHGSGQRHVGVCRGPWLFLGCWKRQGFRIFVQLLKQGGGCHIGKETRVRCCQGVRRNRNDRKHFGGDGGELSAVFPNEGVQEILGLDVRSTASSRGPEGHEDQLAGADGIALEHAFIIV